MSKKKQPSKKITDAVKSWLVANARFCVYDNSDDMHDEESWHHTYDYLVEDTEYSKLSIREFAVKYLSEEIAKVKADLEAEYEQDYGEPIDWNRTPARFEF